MRASSAVGFSIVVLGAVAVLGIAGPLDPPSGPVTPTGKTLTEIEPRIPLGPTTTPGDADSTFRITQPGSYYLTGNIAGAATRKGIEILLGAGQQATIDLNGFTLTGTGSTSTQAAIFIDGVDAHVVVRNGALRNWRHAVQHFLGGSIALEEVHAFDSSLTQFDLRNATVVRCSAVSGSGSGFFVDGGTLTECTARSNTGVGFAINNAATIVRGCAAVNNGGGGFNLGQGIAESCRAEGNTGNGFTNAGVITNCTSLSNTSTGIFCSFAANIRGCTVVGNGSEGIRVSLASRVEGNTVSSNGTHGIRASSSRNTLINNTVASNARSAGAFAGIFVVGNDNAIDSNHVTDLLAGGDDFGIQVTGSSNLIVRNQLSGVSTSFSIASNNTSGGSATNPTTAGPWANITY